MSKHLVSLLVARPSWVACWPDVRYSLQSPHDYNETLHVARAHLLFLAGEIIIRWSCPPKAGYTLARRGAYMHCTQWPWSSISRCWCDLITERRSAYTALPNVYLLITAVLALLGALGLLGRPVVTSLPSGSADLIAVAAERVEYCEHVSLKSPVASLWLSQHSELWMRRRRDRQLN